MHLLLNKIIQALCWTLVHSLWQGIILAVIAGMLITLTKKQAVVTRYNFLVVLLGLFLLGTAVTFCYGLWQASPAPAMQPGISESIAATDVVSTPTLLTGLDDNGIIRRSVFYLNTHADWIVLIWSLVIAMKSLQLITGFRNLHLLKNRQTTTAGAHWDDQLKNLTNRLQISKPVQLLQSGLAKVPMVVGHLKPVILIPAGMLTHLPADEVEAILLHELAHIKRKDYLVNMIQQFGEMIFFFNPAVLWVSYLIKEERENCCDDLAVGCMNNKKQFIQALVSFQEYNLSANEYSLAFPGTRNQLLNRVKRILTNNNKTLNAMEKSILTASLLVTGFMVFAFTQRQQLPEKKQQQPVEEKITIPVMEQPEPLIQQPVSDTTPESKITREKNRTVTTTRNGKEYKLVMKNDQVTELYIDGKKIPENEMDANSEVVNELLQEMKNWREAEKHAEEARMHAEAARHELAEMKERLHGEMELVAKKQHEQMELLKQHQEELMHDKMHHEKELLKEHKELMEKEVIERKLLNEHLSELKEKQLLAEKDYRDHHQELEKNQRLLEREKMKVKQEMERNMREAQRKMEESQRHAERALLHEKQALLHRESSNRIQNIADAVTEDLLDQNIIESVDELSFDLNSKSFTVNGKKQPDEVHQRFKEKYLGSEKDYIRHTRNNKSSNTSISIDKDSSKTKNPGTEQK